MLGDTSKDRLALTFLLPRILVQTSGRRRGTKGDMPRSETAGVPPLRSAEVVGIRPSSRKRATGFSRPHREKKSGPERGGAATHWRGSRGVGGGKSNTCFCKKKLLSAQKKVVVVGSACFGLISGF